MSRDQFESPIDVLDMSAASYAERISAGALQGLVNREKPALFLNYGIYDDPKARQTNEVFMDDAIWYGKYRDMLGNQDQRNLEYYQKEHGVRVRSAENLAELVIKYRHLLQGCVLWDADFPDTVNIALILAGQEGLLPIETSQVEWAAALGLTVLHDLRGRWDDRVALYRWAHQNLFSKCAQGSIACIEPGWQRPEFIDYIVQNKLFVYNLSSQSRGLGSTLLLLLAFGPAWLREWLFALRLDGPLRRFALRWLGNHSAEIKLNNQIQQSVKSSTYPTLFGWHTQRDDELSFMLLLSSNGLRLVPSHLAGNFSFHAGVKPLGTPKQITAPKLIMDPQGIYLTFTLSDGDQLMMMSTAELGNWYSSDRGKMPFNWETQPLLIELAPALLEKFQLTAAASDCLIAGPSGAGYIVPPLAPDLPAYLRETCRICQKAGIDIVTTYVADPPRRVLRQLDQYNEGLAGYLAGYAVLNRAPQQIVGKTVIISNQVPTLNQIWNSADELTAGVRSLIEVPGPLPRFIGVHLFAYKTSFEDIVKFAGEITNSHIHIVRADTFLELARQFLQNASPRSK